MMDVRIVSGYQALIRELTGSNTRVFSCLNGYTLSILLNDRAYDPLIAGGRAAFLVDGISAQRFLGRQGVVAARICGRDLLQTALGLADGPVVAIGGANPGDSSVQEALCTHVGRSVRQVVPPMFRDASELAAFAVEVAPSIQPGSLVMVLIRSPLQDLLAHELMLRTRGAIFVNVGAVIDDIVGQRLAMLRFASKLRAEWLYRLVSSPRRTIPKIRRMLVVPFASRPDLRWLVI
jgi:UDP-N-acetyl-D-mannosaminuronic acid transferase (WecB/TagA/CpsF family)